MAPDSASRDQLMRTVRQANQAVADETREGRRRLATVVKQRRTALVAAHNGGVSWDELAADLGVSRPRIMAMKREKPPSDSEVQPKR